MALLLHRRHDQLMEIIIKIESQRGTTRALDLPSRVRQISKVLAGSARLARSTTEATTILTQRVLAIACTGVLPVLPGALGEIEL